MPTKKTPSPLQQHIATETASIGEDLAAMRRYLTSATKKNKELAKGTQPTYPVIGFSVSESWLPFLDAIAAHFPCTHGDKDNLSGSIRNALEFAVQYKKEQKELQHEVDRLVVDNAALRMTLRHAADVISAASSLVGDTVPQPESDH